MDQEVLEENYGGRLELPEGVAPKTEIKTSMDAYTLAYIHHEAINEPMAPLTGEHTPLHLSKSVSGW
jgi:hypothetical protein